MDSTSVEPTPRLEPAPSVTNRGDRPSTCRARATRNRCAPGGPGRASLRGSAHRPGDQAERVEPLGSRSASRRTGREAPAPWSSGLVLTAQEEPAARRRRSGGRRTPRRSGSRRGARSSAPRGSRAARRAQAWWRTLHAQSSSGGLAWGEAGAGGAGREHHHASASEAEACEQPDRLRGDMHIPWTSDAWGPPGARGRARQPRPRGSQQARRVRGAARPRPVRQPLTAENAACLAVNPPSGNAMSVSVPPDRLSRAPGPALHREPPRRARAARRGSRFRRRATRARARRARR